MGGNANGRGQSDPRRFLGKGSSIGTHHPSVGGGGREGTRVKN